ncbi:MAG: DUF2785 domain-containing protein [Acidobacteriota bacterium]|nr:DUF2785 domain-containing protein [Acidobacteriota bacterium]
MPRSASAVAFALLVAMSWSAAAQPATPRDRAAWVAMARGGFAIPDGQTAVDLLVAMNPLLASPDPVLRDEVAYGAAERWILRERRLSPAELRRVLQMWTVNLQQGLGDTGTDEVFRRSFSALCLSVVAASDLSAPFLAPAEVKSFFDRMLDYFEREKDLRGFDLRHGWMHSVAHTSDALKFLARNPKLSVGVDTRLLAAVRAKVESAGTVFTWGENARMAAALDAAVRRDDADPAALEAWALQWVDAYAALWKGGPQVDARQFARVENATQVMRSLYASLSIGGTQTPAGAAAAKTVLSALAKMR